MKTALAYFKYFLVFNLCFFFLQIVLLFSQDGNFTSGIRLPVKVYLEFLEVFIVHISLYIFLSFLQTVLLLGIIKRTWHFFSIEQWLIIIWTLCVCAILSANSYYFPLSLSSKLIGPLFPKFLIISIGYSSLSLLGLLLINSLLYPRVLKLLFIPLGISVFFYISSPSTHTAKNQIRAARPNIIILGIDSLSPDSINNNNMPFLSKLLKQSTQFTEVISPLARTYPAWNSILTGLYPKHHHAIENLISKERVESKASIIWKLDQLGYNTIYATDDRRFNSIGKEYGFNKVIGPKLGVNDVLLGSFNDFPLSNLLLNFSISSWLFPYNYMNRASYFSYYPDTFNLKLQKELSLEPKEKPIFLAVHFTLPHWPYAWAESSVEELQDEYSIEQRDVLYQKSLHRVDQQFHLFFNYLKENHYFSNSLFIILSDHGEALYGDNSRTTNYHNYQGSRPSSFAQYLKANTATVLNKSAGHGSDILSPQQYNSLLAFNIYEQGKKITHQDKISIRIALIDLAPTILAFSQVDHSEPLDGISLLSRIRSPKVHLPQRTFFIESGMFPNQVFSKEKAIKIGKNYYDINPDSTELELKDSKLHFFEKQRLYGVIQGDWVLALYPRTTHYIPIIQNLVTGQWTDELQSSFAKKTPVEELYHQLSQFYGKKLFLPLAKDRYT